MAARQLALYTPEQYLEMERAAAFKSEYLSGEIFAMAGARERHNFIISNTHLAIGNQLRGKPCRTYVSDMRVHVGTAFVYPDVTVVCGEVKLRDDSYFDNLLNPTVVIEVLSKSTELYDRGEKFIRYAQIESLREYVLISQHTPRVELFSRLPDGSWHLQVWTDLADSATLESIGCLVPLADIYDRVDFDPMDDIGRPEPGSR